MTTPDRRRTPRTRLRDLIYVDLGPDNGGIVLDVSQGGLAFHSVAPIQQTSAIKFSLLVMGKGKFDVSGELAWTDAKRTTCGLKFTSLPQASQEHFENWTASSKHPVEGLQMGPFPGAPSVQPAGEAAHDLPIPAEPGFSVSAPREYNALGSPALTQSRTPFLRNFFLAILFAAVLVAVFELGRRMGESQNRDSTLSTGAQVPRAAPPEVSPAPVPVSAAPNAGAAEISNVGAPSGNTLDNQAESRAPVVSAPVASAPVNGTRADQKAEDGQSEVAAALALLSEANEPGNSSKAARLLWTAVAKGNSRAEVTLADLYLRGDGVAKSCEQGQVLLAAAAKKGSPDAEKKLQDLKTNGCP